MIFMLSQNNADQLIGMRKKFIRNSDLVLHEPFDFSVDLISEDGEEMFALDLRQGTIYLKKIRYQNRYDETIQLVRYESRGIHQNPPELGGDKIEGPHIHMYKEGYGDKFAIPAEDFDNPEDVIESLKKFCEICNIEEINFVHQRNPTTFDNGE
jgi:hypothetical protein